MQVFLVGGAVRDTLLGRQVKEHDYVVVGATPEQMVALGYRPVGKDFPVFLHPQTHQEYALARTERKTAPGYRGFVVHAEPDVTLEEDLRRRDFTINAMAQANDGHIVDPYGGRADLDARLLRHVSEAFAEDPVRILRAARFTARYAGLGFRVAPETRALMRQMVDAGEVDALVSERVWQELSRALGEPHPEAFFEVLRDCGALAKLMPELDRLWGVPQPAAHHPEIDTGVHVMMVLQQAVRLSPDPEVRFAALMHDLGKGVTPEQYWPKHHGHEQASVKLVEQLCSRLRVPNAYLELARHVAADHGNCHRALELRPDTTLKLLERLDAFRRPDRFRQFLLACEADARGRTGFEDRSYPQADWLLRARDAAALIDAKAAAASDLTGPALGAKIRELRCEAIAKLKGEMRPDYSSR